MFMGKRAVARLTAMLVASGTALTLLAAVPAHANDTNAVATVHHMRAGHSAAAPSLTVGQTGLCTDPYFHLGGVFYCGGAYDPTGESWYAFPNGALQVFVIGTDHSVWTRWSNTRRTSWKPWTSMGGSCWSAVYIHSNRYDPTIYVLGSDGRWWHRARLSSGVWTPWHL